jgi:hypothetical protein
VGYVGHGGTSAMKDPTTCDENALKYGTTTKPDNKVRRATTINNEIPR